ncbi:MAG: long-chain fatty acid transporter [Betaproteobacteria bacterium RIFCSPLOWO2_12_FULL_67_28]|nr:MAG: long-chain fatty acid transporter [Betaproteobacteria bacterium RIFCSPLOWO2_12_FULL_67_28]
MKLLRIAVAAALAAPLSALATNGYFQHGYGIKAKGMAGAATATAIDTFGGAVNPAKMVWVGNRIDFGADLFSPRRSVSREGSAAFGGAYNGSVDSDSRYFLIPEFGYNRMINPNLSLGVTVYGNGGMNTDFQPNLAGPAFAPSCAGAQSNMLFGCGRLGVDMMQLIVAPTAAYKVNERNSLGVSPLLAYQRFKVDGLQAFGELGFSSNPNEVSNKGYDSATGFGVRIGWMGKVSDTVTLGAAYSSKVRMGEFDKYKGLFAQSGGFDIPENYNFGIAVKATPKWTVAFDIQQINYHSIASIANGVTNSLVTVPPVAPNRLGDSNGSGFNWRDQTVFKLGMEYEYTKALTVRAGLNYGKSPIRGNSMDDVSFNIIAPGVVETHLTLGATWTLPNKSELTLSYMHAFDKSVTGPSATALIGIGGTETLKMYQNSFGVAYGWKM